MHWNDLAGHEQQHESFQRAAARDRLSHSYLFVGPAGIGKRTFAHLLTQSLFCDRHPDSDLDFCRECSNCHQFEGGAHPDFFAIGVPEGKSEIPIESFIGPRENRGQSGLCHDISLKPMSARRKIAIINDAHLLNESSGNALLKTLEEPPERSILILVAEKEQRILQTIRSRCQMVRFDALSTDQVAGLLVKTGLVDTAERASEIAPHSEGSLETAREFLQHDWLTLRQQIFKILSQQDFNWVQISSQMLEMVESIGSDNPTQRHATGWALRFVQEYCQDEMNRIVQTIPSGRGTRTEEQQFNQLQKMYDRSLVAQQHLEQFLPVGSLIEGLFDELSRIKRQTAGT
ncbi:DNA polymerase III subunit tau [Polystyrenella longa]|uniref:DNA polymerase III subunit tau n=1 Tax=Polystyrenella longa TaxID=2528007 RepID=A0A518CM38_9PLAN|nr:DNA polymerase III subunit [Polystyrenella longa]QDU80296.1 DNA polymerase III subunit tau [Polystyrenella longa]